MYAYYLVLSLIKGLQYMKLDLGILAYKKYLPDLSRSIGKNNKVCSKNI